MRRTDESSQLLILQHFPRSVFACVARFLLHSRRRRHSAWDGIVVVRLRWHLLRPMLVCSPVRPSGCLSAFVGPSGIYRRDACRSVLLLRGHSPFSFRQSWRHHYEKTSFFPPLPDQRVKPSWGLRALFATLIARAVKLAQMSSFSHVDCRAGLRPCCSRPRQQAGRKICTAGTGCTIASSGRPGTKLYDFFLLIKSNSTGSNWW